jgi:hypothetical protein
MEYGLSRVFQLVNKNQIASLRVNKEEFFPAKSRYNNIFRLSTKPEDEREKIKH